LIGKSRRGMGSRFSEVIPNKKTSANDGFRILRKTDMRLMPYTALIYLLCYLDRSNIGMNHLLRASCLDIR
jgi:hypothetical protein